MAEQEKLFDMKAADAADLLAREQPDEAMRDCMRLCEALIFASAEPLSEEEMARHLPLGAPLARSLALLRAQYFTRGVNLVRVGKKWFFRTAPDLAYALSREQPEARKLSRAAIETLAIIAYHQPATRAEIEDIRGVALSKGTLDVLIETGWVRLRGRRRAPGRPVTYGTTESFLLHFGLEQISDLPGLDELKGAGLFDGRLPKTFGMPQPRDDSALDEDEEPLDGDEAGEAFSGGEPLSEGEGENEA